MVFQHRTPIDGIEWSRGENESPIMADDVIYTLTHNRRIEIFDAFKGGFLSFKSKRTHVICFSS
jgi:hypothetical protein